MNSHDALSSDTEEDDAAKAASNEAVPVWNGWFSPRRIYPIRADTYRGIYTINFGLLFGCWIQVENAAQAGAQYAIENAIKSGYSSSKVSAAAVSAASTSYPSFLTAITASATRYCGCPLPRPG